MKKNAFNWHRSKPSKKKDPRQITLEEMIADVEIENFHINQIEVVYAESVN